MSGDEMSFEYIGRDLRTSAKPGLACTKRNRLSLLNSSEKGDPNVRRRTAHEIDRDVKIRDILTTLNIPAEQPCVSAPPLLNFPQNNELHSNLCKGAADGGRTETYSSTHPSKGNSSGAITSATLAPTHAKLLMSESNKPSMVAPSAVTGMHHSHRESKSHYHRNNRTAFVTRNALCEVDPVTKQCMQVNVASHSTVHSSSLRRTGYWSNGINRAPRRGRFGGDSEGREKKDCSGFEMRSRPSIQLVEVSHSPSDRTYSGRRGDSVRSRGGRGG
ncbi:unnamed protein product [Phytomonas sp. EM1]|nr:unnamed protein product [Phytomonas sp. EM1]|eukprot:CCW62516.1 unnamed protein product [Phytomonas sp. isolate EM1]